MEDLPLGRIAALVPEFAVKDLPLGRTHDGDDYDSVFNFLRLSFVFVTVTPRYVNFSTFSNYKFPIIFWFWTTLCWQDVIIYLVFSAFTSQPMSLLAFMTISAFSLIVCKFSPNILTL